MTHKQQLLRSFTITSCLLLILYLATIAPDLTWRHWGGDGGELITAAVTLGVPHPPGYPLYVLIGHLFSYLPFGTVAFRLHLLSAVSMALAAGFVTVSSRELGLISEGPQKRQQWSAIAAGLLFGTIPLVWGQALIAEVYALNALFVGALCWAVLTQRSASTIGLFWGLAVCSHLTSLLLLPLLIWQRAPRQWASLIAGSLVGLTPLLALFWLGQGTSPIVWGEPTTPAGWLWLVSGTLYRSNVFALPLSAWIDRMAAWSSIGIQNWTLPLFFLMLLAPIITPRSQRLRLVGIWVAAGSLLCYAFFYRADDAIVNLIPALLLLSIGLTFVLRQFPKGALILPLLLVALNFNGQSLQGDFSLRANAIQALPNIPPNAILMTPGDQTIFALWYFQTVEGIREDVTIVDRNLFAFGWYRQHLGQQNPSLEAIDIDNLTAFERQNLRHRPVCHLTLVAPVTHHCLEPTTP